MAARKETYRLQSTSMKHAPGIIAWAINGYKFENQRKMLLNLIVATWNLTERCARDLLAGKLPYRVIESDVVEFDYGGKAKQDAPAAVA